MPRSGGAGELEIQPDRNTGANPPVRARMVRQEPVPIETLLLSSVHASLRAMAGGNPGRVVHGAHPG